MNIDQLLSEIKSKKKTPDQLLQEIKEIQDGRKYGRKGKDADENAIVERVLSIVISKIPEPVKGEDGKDAVVDYEKIIKSVIKMIPKPKNGENGKDSKIDYDAIFSRVKEEVAKIQIPEIDYQRISVDAINLLESFEGDARLDAKAIKNIEQNIDIKKLDLPAFPSTLSDAQLDQVKGIFPKLPTEYAQGSGATFLKSLRDVDVKNAKNNDGIFYNATTKKWEAKDVSETDPVTLQEVTNNGATTTKDITAASFIKTDGLSSEFLKADGSSDSTDYLPTATASSTYVPYTGATADVDLGANKLTTNQFVANADAIFNSYQRTKNLATGSSNDFFSYKNVGMFYEKAANVTGYIIIELPKYKTTMYRWRITGYNYYDLTDKNGAWTLDAGAYLRTGTNAIIRNGGVITGNAPFTKVTYLNDSVNSKHYLVLGESTTTWYYPSFTIDVDDAFNDWSSEPQKYTTIYRSATLPSYTQSLEENVSRYGTDITMPNDNAKLYQGAGSDYSQYFDGTNQNFDLTSGDFVFTGGSIRVNDIVDNPLRLIKSSGTNWNYIEFYKGATRTGYFGMDASNNFKFAPTNNVIVISGYTRIERDLFLRSDSYRLYQGAGDDYSQYYDGTNQNFNLTSGSFKFNGGNIGINVSNPTYILDINGTSSSPAAIVRLTANSVNNDAALILNERFDLGCEIRYTGGTGNNLQFNMNSGSGMSNYMEINRDTGNLNVVYSALIGGQAQEVNNLSQLKVSASDDNGGIVINRMTTDTGAYAGIKFSSTVVTRDYLKAGIFFARTGSNGVGDLSFAFNNISNSSNVDIDDTTIKMTKEGHLKLIQDNSKLYFGADDDEYLEYDPTLDGIQTAGKFKASEVRAIHKAVDGTAPVADGTYVVGKGLVTDGTITIKDGVITAIQEASNI
jgi:hypothetical protein